MSYATQEAPYLGSAVFVPEHEESIWYCPECLANGRESKLHYDAESKLLFCFDCPSTFASDADLAEAYTEHTGELLGRLKDMERQIAAMNATIEYVREVVS